jgi:hypothetical protein
MIHHSLCVSRKSRQENSGDRLAQVQGTLQTRSRQDSHA